MEEIFEEVPTRIGKSPLAFGGSMGRSAGQRAAASVSCDNAATSPLLSSTKALSIELILKKLRPMTFEQFISKVESNETDDLKVDLMNTFLSTYPEADELAAFDGVKLENLTHSSDKLCWHLARKPLFKLRIELILAKETVFGELSKIKRLVELLKEACNSARGYVVQTIFRKCLQYGNYLNQGSMWADAAGFSLTSLQALLQLRGKGSNSGVKLVDLLAAFIDIKSVHVEDVINALMAVKAYVLKDIKQEADALAATINKLKTSMENSKKQDILDAFLPFIAKATAELGEAKEHLANLDEKEAELQVYLCAGAMSLNNMFQVLEQCLRLIVTAIKKEESNALTRAKSMVSLPTMRENPRGLCRGGEALSRKSLALKTRDLPVEDLRKLFMQGGAGVRLRRTKEEEPSELSPKESTISGHDVVSCLTE